MSLRYGARYWTIFIVIELTVISTQISAFTFERITTGNTLTDLTDAASANLEVRRVPSGNDVPKVDVEYDATAQRIVPIETTAKTEEIQKNATIDESGITTGLPSSTEIEHETHNTTETKTTGTTLNDITDVVTSSAKDEANEPTSEDASETDTVSSKYNTVSKNLRKSIAKDESSTNQYSSTEETISERMMVSNTDEINTTGFSTEFVGTNEDAFSTKETAGNSEVTSGTMQTSPIIQQSDSSTPVFDDPETTSLKTELDNTDKSTNEPITETLTGEYISDTVIPYWKKYTVIDRKRPSTSADEDSITSTEREEEMVRADTAQSRIIFKNSLNTTPNVPSLEILTDEFLWGTSKLPSTRSVTSSTSATEHGTFTTGDSTTATDAKTIPLLAVSASENGKASKLEILTSQRAGFLDYSSKLTTASEATATDNGTSSTEENNDAEKATTLEVKASPKTTSTASQSQLAEDAINEELMKEEMLSDNMAYTNRYRGERFDVKKIKNIVDVEKISTPVYQDNTQSIQVNLTDDKLSVKPINADKSKNSGLYTVNPNYKPLRKLEVQPPKPFVRDPDDNSWRNESLSSLGIVFKGKNSTKIFTQVLKNKTEAQLATLIDKYNKGQELELRERLEKIAEMRKSKKKKEGDIFYGNDVESNSSKENLTTPEMEFNVPFMFPLEKVTNSYSTISPAIETNVDNETATPKDVTKTLEFNPVTTEKSTKQFNIESFDGNDEDDAEYISLSNIDLKKFLTPQANSETPFKQTTLPVTYTQTSRQNLPDRRPTLQYFPPRAPQKVHINEYDDVFQRKVNEYTVKEPTNQRPPITYPTIPTYSSENVRLEQYFKENTARPTTESPRVIRPVGLDTNNYRAKEPSIEFSAENQDGAFNKASLIIKHLKDIIDEAAKDSGEERTPTYILTEAPTRDNGNEFIQQNRVKTSDYDDYDSQFRREVLNRFVDNFNQNSERFKVDFPVLYNTSVVHSQSAENGKVQASSSAFLKRLYDEAKGRPSDYVQRSYDPNCDRLVELSPEYELHYYVPGQEEREEVEPRASTLPQRFRIQGYGRT